MSSELIDSGAGILLECGMDFRDNWQQHFRAIVESEKPERGTMRQAYVAVATKICVSPETIYQYYNKKSGKQYPSRQIMQAIERKYGNGRAPGWTNLPLDGNGAGRFTPEVLAKLAALDASEFRQCENQLRQLLGLRLLPIAVKQEEWANAANGKIR